VRALLAAGVPPPEGIVVEAVRQGDADVLEALLGWY
jgi:hypothetical protein